VIRDNSDASWEKWGKQNPYYGVLTDDKFRQENLNEELKAEFLETGRAHIDRVLEIALSHCGAMASRKRALDFGCGTGRLVIPLARLFEHVTCVDISAAMLEVAKENCVERGIHNADFVRSDDGLTRVTGKFDFIHSYLVLQHIPIRRGEKIVAQLLDRLNDEGILAIHFPFMRNDSIIRKSVHFLRKNFRPLSVLANIIRGKHWNEPFIQMNSYDVNRILISLSKHGIRDVFLEVVDAGGFVSAFVFAKKPKHPMGSVQGKHLWAAELKG
jgi:2-polyprenyl-3-methyl-5-hydroxy-6-metoxy-1,4-benzoquinol methylase